MSDAVDVNSADSWPDDADDVAEGYLANWFVREGSAVDEGETLCEIQVEKVSIDVAAPTAGTVTEILVAEGGDFDRGDVLARVQPSA
ncbi:lipoyl-binding domain-containing protein [Haloferax gibbonsii ATCC 33959]|uniref:Lipoyl-binding domain-containing protein n=1 Tax=Haloferax gibbonsii (strain ATCC 33959 / DSM 4427 / JCM 8863 / NBRC 102184 / NCIMB 2188 / Ma 2.38) TaxID=1227459 RepID=M0HC09_HALGM|nr:lipoyl domain-containing protein [Haloferax gibbonsii]ELZ81262.1 lipoyl-binding domain-containing protein [Haloferax gibbonsii ATCC 33959]